MGVVALLLSATFFAGALAHHGHAGSHKVVIILFDGFRWDYLKIKGLKAFPQFIKDGAWVEKMTVAYPAISYPQYYTVMTGLYAESHGMVGNDFYDPVNEKAWLFANNPEYNHTTFYDKGEPFWVTATKQGKKCALFYWPACEIEIQKINPAYCDPYFNWPNQTYIHTAFESTLDMLENGYDFSGIYVEETDKMGHKYGPYSKEINDTVRRYDEELVQFLAGLKAKDLADKTDVILVADHGMTPIDKVEGRDLYIQLTKNFTQEEWNRTVLYVLDWMIYPTQENYTQFIYEKIKNLHPKLHVYLREDFPKHYHFQNDRRIAPILFILDPPYRYTTNFTRMRTQPTSKGTHGYIPEMEDMKAIFLGMGPDFIPGSKQSSIITVDIYQLMCRMLGIKPAPNNGTWSHVTDITVFGNGARSGLAMASGVWLVGVLTAIVIFLQRFL